LSKAHLDFYCRMKNFLNKQREIISLLAYAAIVASLVYLVILPLLVRIEDINNQIQEEAMNQESVRLHIEQLPRIQKQYETVINDVDLTNALLDKEKAVVLIEKLEKMAENTKNEITISVQESAPAKKSSAKVVSPAAETLATGLPSQDYLQIKINLVGSYNSIVEFVARLEKFEYYSDIIAVQINKEDMSKELNRNTSNVGMFSKPVLVGSEEISKSSANDSLSASLDTVFYTN